jgi:hypothetical protein
MDDRGAGLTWELTHPNVPDRWRAVGSDGTVWGASPTKDGWWHISRWPQAQAKPQTVGLSPTLEDGQALAEELARG